MTAAQQNEMRANHPLCVHSVYPILLLGRDLSSELHAILISCFHSLSFYQTAESQGRGCFLCLAIAHPVPKVVPYT